MTTTAAAEPLTREQMLLRMILLDPANDAPRLVHADWLEEHGDTARAEFIRTQIELASKFTGNEWQARYNKGTLPAGHPVMIRQNRGTGLSREMLDSLAEYNERQDRLRQRERGLFAAAAESAMQADAGLWGLPWRVTGWSPNCINMDSIQLSATTTRGFPGHVSAPLAVLLGGQCERCGGDGQAHGSDRPWQWNDDPDYMRCPAKCNKGRTPGILAALGALVPLERVTASDCEPDSAVRNGKPVFWWIHGTDTDAALSVPAVVPHSLWATEALGENGQFATRAAALDALSAALVRHGRAGVPWLNPPVPCGRCQGTKFVPAKTWRGTGSEYDETASMPCPDCTGIAPAAVTPTGGRT